MGAKEISPLYTHQTKKLTDSIAIKSPFTIVNYTYMGMGQNHVALVNIKIGGKWMFIP
jgi:hypothetical protein